MDGKRFMPKDIGRIVNKFLTDHFTRYVDYGFTAHMEDELDEVSRGERDWVQVLDEFWQPFEALVKDKEASVTREQVAQARDLGTDPASGKPVSVRMGRFGPFAQIGTKDDEDKPRFAGLRPGQKMATITLGRGAGAVQAAAQARRHADDEPVSASVGRFGPYVQYGKKYVSLKQDDPYTITLERALEVIREKKIADANRLILDFPDAGIQVLNGRYGPYITDKERNARIPKDRDPEGADAGRVPGTAGRGAAAAQGRVPRTQGGRTGEGRKGGETRQGRNSSRSRPSGLRRPRPRSRKSRGHAAARPATARRRRKPVNPASLPACRRVRSCAAPPA